MTNCRFQGVYDNELANPLNDSCLSSPFTRFARAQKFHTAHCQHVVTGWLESLSPFNSCARFAVLSYAFLPLLRLMTLTSQGTQPAEMLSENNFRKAFC